jgi:hypothetical protein
MEDEDSKVAVKPDRTPDYVTTYGSAYWWQEMVYVGATGEVGRILIEEDIVYLMRNRSFGVTQKVQMNPTVRDIYNKWWYDIFESKFLGEE